MPLGSKAERRASTEERLLEAAYSIVADHGVRAVTTAAVGELAGYSRGMVNYHFGTRDEMMARLSQMVQSRFAVDWGGRRGREHVLKLVDEYLKLARSRSRDMSVFLRLWAAAIGDEEPGLRDAYIQRDALMRGRFKDAILEGQADGTISAAIDPASAALAIAATLRGIAMQWQVDPELAQGAAARKTALALIERGLRPS